MSKPRIATLWLDGCSGCHMSLLDMDERIIALAGKIELVYGPLVDIKEFPEGVDVAVVEGAVSSVEDEHKIRIVRERSKFLIALGDCAVTANVPGMRNYYTCEAVLDRAYYENATIQAQTPNVGIPALLPKALPLHEFVKVDLFVPGCPPQADAIYYVLSELVEGRIPDLAGKTRFGI
ncbi:MAG: NADP oxidoreductase [bacterium]